MLSVVACGSDDRLHQVTSCPKGHLSEMELCRSRNLTLNLPLTLTPYAYAFRTNDPSDKWTVPVTMYNRGEKKWRKWQWSLRNESRKGRLFQRQDEAYWRERSVIACVFVFVWGVINSKKSYGQISMKFSACYHWYKRKTSGLTVGSSAGAWCRRRRVLCTHILTSVEHRTTPLLTWKTPPEFQQKCGAMDGW